MGFRCGIVGLPNVGKSTLFNALTETQAAQAANYPFCTIAARIRRHRGLARCASRAEAGWLAEGDDARFMSDVALRMHDE